MKKIFFILFILLTSCVAKDGPFSPSLAMVLDGIINKNPEYNVIQIQASKLEGHELLFITCLHNYNPKMTESYYIYKNKLVTYFQTDENDRSYIIDHNFLYKYDGRKLNYNCIYSSKVTSEPKQQVYEIIGNNKLALLKRPEKIVYRKNKIEGNNVVLNKQLNEFINSYIYNNIDVLYELRFKEINNKHYAIIRSMIYYDKNKYDGYFFRDGNLVVIYGIDASENFLDKTWIKKDNRGIPNFKYRTIDEWNYPYPLKLEIFSNGNVKELSLSEGFAI
ncbi:MAG: hypothetical protein ACLT05_09610 [Segatella copri]|uniref:hypothetical protein n=1 Tax=Phocaeicola dorei TaxID=357276 RepID=UPI00266BE51C|nr:hypothetical protein [uncultured Prevotella sp.]MDU6396712.1 hypothetical protein [Bacteroides sp.]